MPTTLSAGELAQGEDQLAAEQVARRFARDDCDGARASRQAQRMMPRVDWARKSSDTCNSGQSRDVRRNLLLRVFESQARFVERLVRALDRGDRVGRKTAPACRPSELMPCGCAVLPDAITNGGISCSTTVPMRGECVRADAAELVHRGEAAEDRVVADVHVAGELRVVGEDRVVADLAVVREVHVGHDPVVVAEPRHAARPARCRN